MKQIRLGLESGIDIKGYAKPEFPAKLMKELRISLEEGFDLTKYANESLDPESIERLRINMKQTRKAREEEVETQEEYILSLDNYVIPTIDVAMSDNLYLVPNMQNLVDWKMQYSQAQLNQITFGLWVGVDVTRYLDPRYDEKQMVQIRWGLEEGKDVSIYAKPQMPWRTMHEIRINLQ